MQRTTDIFTRLLNGETVPFNDPEYQKLRDVSFATRRSLLQLNQSADPEEMRALLSRITGRDRFQRERFTSARACRTHHRHLLLLRDSALEFSHAFELSQVAAAEDGRTPVHALKPV